MNQTNTNPIYGIEIQEIIQKIRDAGYSELIDCLLHNEKDCYTKKGRLNKSSTCRKINWKGKKLEDALDHMRILLQGEFDFDIININKKNEDEDEDEDEDE